MKCLKCKHENSPKAKFCEECAAPLGRACPNCGNRVSTTAKFCSQCGTLVPIAEARPPLTAGSYTPQHLADKILASRAALEGERKQITVLFADVQGSMELLADLDPEDAHKLLDPVIECMIDAVHRYEGVVHRVLGDGIMALFGAPLAHEDHAVRACYAALWMQERMKHYADEAQRAHGMPVTIRVGLNSGEIVISTIGHDLTMDYSVVGQTVHLAARLESMAKPGSILTSASTSNLADGFVAMRPLGPMQVKGLPEPVPTFEVTGDGAARTRLQAAAGRGLTRFSGREAELGQLRIAQKLAAEGHGQVVAIVGEAGIGKSRLVHEFVHSEYSAGWLVVESSSVSYGRATSYLPVIEFVRRYFKINFQDSNRAIQEKIAAKILALDPTLLDAIPPMLDLLDALEEGHPFRSLDPLQHRQFTYNAVTRLMLSETRVQPVIAIFEDLHWHDALSLGLLNELVVVTQSARLLLVVNYRPEYQDEWRNRRSYHQLGLSPLAGADLSGLLEALLGPDPSLAELQSFLVDRASGNPFFAEEIVRSLVDSGVLGGAHGNYRLTRPFSSDEVPPTVQAVLAARIDALPPAEKRLLQYAAVIGHDVPLTLLQAICGLTDDEMRGLISHLQTAEFLIATQLFPDLQYTFRHALTHSVTYGGVLRDRRRDIHALVVEAIERLYADRLGEKFESLAQHAVRGELNDKAVYYLRQAGAKAAARSALADARTQFEQALGILNRLPKTRAALEQALDIRLDLRPVLRQLGEGRQMLEQLRVAESLAEELKDDRRLGLVCAFMTTVQSTLNEVDQAVISGTRALEIARRIGDLQLRILASTYLEQAHYYRGEYNVVIDQATEILAVLPAEWVHEYFGMAVPPSVFGRAWLIMSLAERGHFAEASRHAAAANRIAERTQHAFTIGWSHFAASMLNLLKGDWTDASVLAEEWVTLLRTNRIAIHLPWALASSALAFAELGQTVEALDRVQEAEGLLDGQAARGIVGHRGWGYGALGRACLLLGKLDEAQRLGERSVEFTQGQPGFTAHAHHLLGDVAIHPERFDVEAGAARYREAMSLAEAHGMRPLIAHCHAGLGKLYRRAGRPDLARQNIGTAAKLYRDLEMPLWLEPDEADVMNPVPPPIKIAAS